MAVRYILFFFFSFSSIIVAQIAVTNNAPMNNEEYLVNNILLGDDLETSNFSSVGFAAGIGYFDAFSANIGFQEGVILSTGGLEFVTGGFGAGSAISGDADLELALNAINLNWDVNNVTILEFDFVAESESVAFNYVFGSMEYTSYTCSVFNDIFGFFLSGPGITGPYSNNAINLAYIPDPDNPGQYTTTPVAVNTVNSGVPSNFNASTDCDNIDPDWADYNIYWVDNQYDPILNDWQGVNEPPEPNFTVEGITGFTTPLTAEYNGLICGETYHIKLAIADASDGALNSVVFLEANSFVSPDVEVLPISNIDGPDLFGDTLAIYEGCAAAQLEFNATGNTEYDILLSVLTTGECTYGEDFEISYEDGTPIGECMVEDPAGLGDIMVPCINIPPNQSTTYLNIQAFYDNVNENMEDLIFTINAINGVCQQADLAVSEITFNLYDQIPIVIDPGPADTVVCFGDLVTLEPNDITGGYIGETDDYIYEWYDQNGVLIGNEASVSVTSSIDSEYTLTVYDDCQDQMVSANCAVVVQEYSPVEMEFDLNPAEPCYGDIVEITLMPDGGSGDYDYVWEGNDNINVPSYNYTFEFGDPQQFVDLEILDNCSAQLYDFQIPIDLIQESPITNTSNPPSVCYGDVVEIIANPDGGSGDYSYLWPGSENPCDDCDSYQHEFDIDEGAEQVVTFQIIDNCTSESFDQQVTVDLIQLSPITNTSTPPAVCYGDVVEIISNPDGGSGDYSYLWPDSSDPCDCDSYQYEFDVDGGAEQEVTFEIIDNCTNESFEHSVLVLLDMNSPEPENTILPDGMQICPGDEIELIISVDGVSTYSYEWGNWTTTVDDVTSTIFNVYSTSDVITVSPDEDTTYWVQVVDDCNNYIHGPYAYTVEIPTYDPPTFELPSLSGCEGDVVEIVPYDKFTNVMQSEDDYTYLWSNGETTPTIEVVIEDEPTEYTLTIYDLCGNPGTENINGDIPVAEVIASLPPAPEFVFDQDGSIIQFEQLTEGIFTEFEWDFNNDGSIDSYEFEPLHTYDAEGDFTVVLNAYDDLGCRNSYNAIVNVYATLFFYAPDVFTPDGNGINELFNVSVVGHKEDEFELLIFDRWGNRLFYTQDSSDGWDGKYPNGKEVPQDIYMFKANMVKDGTDEKTIKKGRISVIK